MADYRKYPLDFCYYIFLILLLCHCQEAVDVEEAASADPEEAFKEDAALEALEEDSVEAEAAAAVAGSVLALTRTP